MIVRRSLFEKVTIGEGNTSQTLSYTLPKSEQEIDTLQSEIEGLNLNLSNFNEFLELNTSVSATVLRNLLGLIEVKVHYIETGKPYYVADLSINTFAITEPLSGK